MSNALSMYQASVPVLLRALANLRHVLAKGEAHARDKGYEPTILLQSRLAPDMFPLVRQVQFATDTAKFAVARLAGVESPRFDDVETTVEELALPFGAVATDLASGRGIWLPEGRVADVVRVSIALPGLFTPCEHEGRLLVDGALVNPVPVSLCRAMGADFVIAVDMGSSLAGRHVQSKARNREPNMIEVLAESISIMQVRITRSRLAGARRACEPAGRGPGPWRVS